MLTPRPPLVHYRTLISDSSRWERFELRPTDLAFSYGEAYPERVKLGVNVLDRLLGEAGEFAVVTDR